MIKILKCLIFYDAESKITLKKINHFVMVSMVLCPTCTMGPGLGMGSSLGMGPSLVTTLCRHHLLFSAVLVMMSEL